MSDRTGKRLVAAAAGCAALGMIAPPLSAQTEVDIPDSIEEFAFDAADTDGDGLIGEAELARDAAAGFTKLDENGDGVLTPDELGPHDPADFDSVDANGDGELTFNEIMDHKLEGFNAADKDGDGYLTLEEMIEGAAAEQGVAP